MNSDFKYNNDYIRYNMNGWSDFTWSAWLKYHWMTSPFEIVFSVILDIRTDDDKMSVTDQPVARFTIWSREIRQIKLPYSLWALTLRLESERGRKSPLAKRSAGDISNWKARMNLKEANALPSALWAVWMFWASSRHENFAANSFPKPPPLASSNLHIRWHLDIQHWISSYVHCFRWRIDGEKCSLLVSHVCSSQWMTVTHVFLLWYVWYATNYNILK